MPKPVTIAQMAFPSCAAGKRYAKLVLHEGQIGSAVDPKHHSFLVALLFARQEKVAEIGDRVVAGFVRDRQPHEHSHALWNKSIWAVFEDGTRLDFSLYDSVDALASQQKGHGKR